jgi:hypothetical protein
MADGKGFGRKRSWPNLGANPVVTWRDGGKLRTPHSG